MADKNCLGGLVAQQVWPTWWAYSGKQHSRSTLCS